MTPLEKIEANERKQELITALNNTCQKCFNQFNNLHLSHKISASKANIKLFGRKVMYHDLMMLITCDKCNSSVMKNRGSNPIQAQELLITIIYNLYCEGEDITTAFNNLGKCISVNNTYIELYNELKENVWK